MTRDTDSSSSSGAQGRGGAAYPSGTPPYGARPFPSLHPREQPAPPAEPAPAEEPQPAPDEPRTETTLTTRIRINIPGSRPIPPVVVRTPVGEGGAAVPPAAEAAETAAEPQAPAAEPERPERPEPAEKKDKATSDWFAPRKPVTPQPPDAGPGFADGSGGSGGSGGTGTGPGAGSGPGSGPDPSGSGFFGRGGPEGAFADPDLAENGFAEGGFDGAADRSDTGAFARPGAFGDPDTGSRPYPPAPGSGGPADAAETARGPHDTPAAGMPAFGTDDFPPGVPRPTDPFAADPFAAFALHPDDRAPEFPPPSGPTAGPVRGVMSVPPYGPGARPSTGGEPGPDASGPIPEERPGPYDLRGDAGAPAAPAGYFTGPAAPGGPSGPGGPGMPAGPGTPAGFAGPRGDGFPAGPGAPGGRGGADTLVGGIPPVPPAESGGPRVPGPPAPAPSPAAAPAPSRSGAPARKGRSKVVLLGAAVAGLAVLAYGAGLLMNHADVPKGTTVLGVQIGNMTRDDAVRTLDKALGQRTTAPLTLTVGGRKQELKPSVAGLSFDVDATVRGAAHTDYNPVSVIGSLFGGTRTAKPVILVDNDKLKAALTGIVGNDGKATEPMVRFANHKAIAVPGRPGTAFDVNAAAAQVAAAYRTRAETGADKPIALAVTTAPPKVSQADLDRAVNGFGKAAMSGQIMVRAYGTHEIPFNNSIPTFLTMVPNAQGTLQPHIDLAVLKKLYGQTFNGVLLQRADGSKTPVTSADVAAAVIQALGSTDPAGRTVTLPRVVK